MGCGTPLSRTRYLVHKTHPLLEKSAGWSNQKCTVFVLLLSSYEVIDSCWQCLYAKLCKGESQEKLMVRHALYFVWFLLDPVLNRICAIWSRAKKNYTDRIRCSTSVKLVYSYTFLKIANKNLPKIGFELPFTCTFTSLTIVPAGRSIATALTEAMGMPLWIVFSSLCLMHGHHQG